MTTLTADNIARMAVLILENNLVMAKKVYRGYEEDVKKETNGYKEGGTIRVRRPVDYTVRESAVMNVQDTDEGEFSLVVDKRRGVDFAFSSQDLTLSVSKITERFIEPAMIQLANRVDTDLMAEFKNVSKWVGTPGQTINSNQDFAKGPQRLDLMAVPQKGRSAVLHPDDHWGLIGAQTSLLNDRLVGSAYTEGSLGRIGGVETYMSQNVPTFTNATHSGTPLTKGGGQAVTYAASKNTNTQTLITDGWDSGAVTLTAGTVFTIEDVYDVNPVSKATLAHLKQFVVVTEISDTTGDITLTMSPAAISSGAQQTVSADIADGKAIVVVGATGGLFPQNMMFNKNAFALVMCPLVAPPGAVEVARRSKNGCEVRVIPVYDGINDVSKWRLDVLYGIKTIDERQALRISGTS